MIKVRKIAIKILADHLQADTVNDLIEEWEDAGYNKKDCRQVAELYATYKYLTGQKIE